MRTSRDRRPTSGAAALEGEAIRLDIVEEVGLLARWVRDLAHHRQVVFLPGEHQASDGEIDGDKLPLLVDVSQRPRQDPVSATLRTISGTRRRPKAFESWVGCMGAELIDAVAEQTAGGPRSPG